MESTVEDLRNIQLINHLHPVYQRPRIESLPVGQYHGVKVIGQGQQGQKSKNSNFQSHSLNAKNGSFHFFDLGDLDL